MLYKYRSEEGKIATCNICGNLLLATIDNRRVAIQPCIEIVLGTSPLIHSQFTLESGRRSLPIRNIHFICTVCQPNVIADINERISSIGVHIYNGYDKPDLEEEKGCWVTITEYIPERNGFYANIQVDPETFGKIIEKISPLYMGEGIRTKGIWR